MNKVTFKRALNAILQVAENANCSYLNHSKKQDYHSLGLPCPVEERLKKQAEIVRKYVKNNPEGHHRSK